MTNTMTPETSATQAERQLVAIKTITSALENKTNVEDIVRESLEIAVDTLDAQAGSILLCDSTRERLVFRYVVGPTSSDLTGREISADEGIAGHVFQTGEPQMTGEAGKDKHFLPDVDRDLNWQTNTLLTVPLKTLGNRSLGVMQILNKCSGSFDRDDLELLAVVASQAASAINAAKLHEEARLAAVVRAMGDISHDIKNMLTPVITCAQTLDAVFESTFGELDTVTGRAKDGADRSMAGGVTEATSFLREFYPQAIEMLLDGAESVQERVRQLADCVKGHVTAPHFEEKPVVQVAEKVVRALEVVAAKHGITLRTNGLNAVPVFPIDEKQIYSAFYNLVNNAIPETPAGGSIAIRGQVDTVDGRRIACLSVTDTGRGIPEHIRASLFTDDAISTKAGGTGLGTRIVKNVVDVHGGTVTVESEEGKGTTFTLRLPMDRQAEDGKP